MKKKSYSDDGKGKVLEPKIKKHNTITDKQPEDLTKPPPIVLTKRTSSRSSFPSKHITEQLLTSTKHKGLQVQATDKSNKFLRVVLDSNIMEMELYL